MKSYSKRMYFGFMVTLLFPYLIVATEPTGELNVPQPEQSKTVQLTEPQLYSGINAADPYLTQESMPTVCPVLHTAQPTSSSNLEQIYAAAAANLITPSMSTQGGRAAAEVLYEYLVIFNNILVFTKSWLLDFFTFYTSSTMKNFAQKLLDLNNQYSTNTRYNISNKIGEIFLNRRQALVTIFEKELAAEKLLHFNTRLKAWSKNIKKLTVTEIAKAEVEKGISALSREKEQVIDFLDSILTNRLPNNPPLQLRKSFDAVRENKTSVENFADQTAYFNTLTLQIINRINQHLFTPIVLRFHNRELCATDTLSLIRSIHQITASFAKAIHKSGILNDGTLKKIMHVLSTMKNSIAEVEVRQVQREKALYAIKASIEAGEFTAAYAQLKMARVPSCAEEGDTYAGLDNTIFEDQLKKLYSHFNNINLGEFLIFSGGGHPVDELIALQSWLENGQFGFAKPEFKEKMMAALDSSNSMHKSLKKLQEKVVSTIIAIIDYTIFENIPSITQRVTALPQAFLTLYQDEIRESVMAIKRIYTILKNYGVIAKDGQLAIDENIAAAENALRVLNATIREQFQ